MITFSRCPVSLYPLTFPSEENSRWTAAAPSQMPFLLLMPRQKCQNAEQSPGKDGGNALLSERPRYGFSFLVTVITLYGKKIYIYIVKRSHIIKKTTFSNNICLLPVNKNIRKVHLLLAPIFKKVRVWPSALPSIPWLQYLQALKYILLINTDCVHTPPPMWARSHRFKALCHVK